MTKKSHPYQDRPDHTFWKSAVANLHYADMRDLWAGMTLPKTDKIATAGSCFAQHIGRALHSRGAHFMDMEPAPHFVERHEARKWGYGVYTARQLLQLYQEAFQGRKVQDDVWEKDGRFFDALRPAVDPVGQADAATVRKLREVHLEAVRKMFRSLDLFVMTLGLTEAWVSTSDGTVYPTAPGTIAGDYDPKAHAFVNFTYPEVLADMKAFWALLKQENPKVRMLLTVSPVPLNATATSDHVMVATTYSKSTLRAVAGDLAQSEKGIFYFPSYEIITAPSGRGMYYDPDWRNVNQYGVDYVMTHFFAKLRDSDLAAAPVVTDEEFDVVCDEAAMFRAIGK
jgi:hypothetical protein